MAGLINELLSVLDEEIDYMKQLSSMADSKKEYIINNNIDSLRDLTAKENLIVSKFSRLEKQRIVLIKDIAEVLNENVNGITIKSLVHTIRDQAESKELESCMFRINDALYELKRKNDQNGMLLQSSLDYVDFTMNLIRGAATNKLSVLDSDGNEMGDTMSFLDIKH